MHFKRPMLAYNKSYNVHTDLTFPVVVSAKLDGVRATVVEEDGKIFVASRSKKPIANKFIQKELSKKEYVGLDGELIVGKVNAADVFNVSSAAVRTIEGTPDFTYYVFDKFDTYGVFTDRLESIPDDLPRVVIVPHLLVDTPEELLKFHALTAENNYEGTMIRSLDGLYKQGRSTLKEGYLLKLKNWEDSEAKIVDIYEAMENLNEAKINELGLTSRSKNRENLVPKGMLGGFVVQDVHHPEWGVLDYPGHEGQKVFGIGSCEGMSHEERVRIWENRKDYIGHIVKYKYTPYGMVDSPRLPIWVGFRSEEDM